MTKKMNNSWKRRIYVYLLSVISLPALSASMVSSPVTTTTWNLEWLTLTPTNSIKESFRSSRDFEVLKATFRQISPDILAFQEVDSISAIQRVVGNDYQIYLSDRSKAQYAHLQFNNINQYTGFAISKGWLKSNQATIIDPNDLELLSNSKLRFASYLVIQRLNKPDLHLLSVHLKHGCATKKKRSRSCRQLSKQTDVLHQWLTARVGNQQAFIILGDFNHNLAYQGDWMWQQLTKGMEKQAQLLTQATPALCQVKSNRHPKKLYRYPYLIDHIIASPVKDNIRTQQVTFSKQAVLANHLTDHCPVVSEALME